MVFIRPSSGVAAAERHAGNEKTEAAPEQRVVFKPLFVPAVTDKKTDWFAFSGWISMLCKERACEKLRIRFHLNPGGKKDSFSFAGVLHRKKQDGSPPEPLSDEEPNRNCFQKAEQTEKKECSLRFFKPWGLDRCTDKKALKDRQTCRNFAGSEISRRNFRDGEHLADGSRNGECSYDFFPKRIVCAETKNSDDLIQTRFRKRKPFLHDCFEENIKGTGRSGASEFQKKTLLHNQYPVKISAGEHQNYACFWKRTAKAKTQNFEIQLFSNRFSNRKGEGPMQR